MNYERIVIVGTTRLAGNCALKCNNYLPTEVIENADVPINNLLVKSLGSIPFQRLDKSSTMNYLSKIAEKTVVFSILNHFIFPGEIVNMQNLTIVNFHPALLPKYPGRNSEAWAIYEEENETGITWHYIDKNVDNGFMITQKKVDITQNDTAISLFVKQMAVAEESFAEILPQVLNDSSIRIPLNTNPADIKLSNEIPNNGIFDLSWNFKKAGCFLRSMDFGFRPQFPTPKIQIDGVEYSWKKYSIQHLKKSSNKVLMENENIVIGYEDGTIILKNVFLSR